MSDNLIKLRSNAGREILSFFWYESFKKGINICLLRNKDQLIYGDFNDIDVASSTNNRLFLNEIIKNLETKFEYKIINIQNSHYLVSYLFLDTTNIDLSIRLDIFLDLKKGPFKYHSLSNVIRNSVWDKDLECLVASQKHQDVIALKRDFLFKKNKLNFRKLIRILNAENSIFESLMGIVNYSFFVIKEKISNLFSRPFIIAFIGIDGSGKTSLSLSLKKGLVNSEIYDEVLYKHYGDKLLPSISSIFKIFRPTNKKIEEINHIKNTLNEEINPLRGTILFFYSFIDHLIQSIIEIISHNNRSLIIKDRYIYEFIYSRYSSITRKIALFFYNINLISRPSLLVMIKVNPKTAWERKNELPIQIGNIYQTRIYNFFKNENRSQKIQITSDNKEISQIVLDLYKVLIKNK